MKEKFVIPAIFRQAQDGERSRTKAKVQIHSNPEENMGCRFSAESGSAFGMTWNDKWKIFNWFLIFLISIPIIVSAQAPDPAPVNTVLTNFLALLTVVIKILISSAFVVFGWGVVTFILASNDQKKIREAKNIILYGIIGIFVLASLGGIIIFFQTYFGIPNNTPIVPPTFTVFLNSFVIS